MTSNAPYHLYLNLKFSTFSKFSDAWSPSFCTFVRCTIATPKLRCRHTVSSICQSKHIFTARIPKEWRRYCFHRYLSVHNIEVGYPHLADWGYPRAAEGDGVPPQSELDGGTLHHSPPPTTPSGDRATSACYAFCVHAGGFSCFISAHNVLVSEENQFNRKLSSGFYIFQ